jgi:MFS family permease
MQRKIRVGEVLGEAFAIYRDQAGVLLPVAFWLFLVAAVIEALTAGAVGLFLLSIVVSLTVGTLYQGMVVGLVSDVQDGRRESSVGDLMRSVLPVLGPLIGAGLLAALGIAGGFLLLVVPGLYLLTIWAVVAPVIVVERRGVSDAFGRSRQLVRDNGWPVFWTVVAAFLIAMVAALAFVAIAESLSDLVLIRIVFNALASMVTAPIAALVASVLYFRLREIRDSTASAAEELPPVAS